MSNIIIRSTEPEDASALKAIYECPNAYGGTLQLPHPSNQMWVERLDKIPEGVYGFVAEIDGEVVGNLGFHCAMNPRRKHSGYLGMGIKDSYQGMGVGSALMAAMIDLTDNWLDIRRIELTVFTDNERAIALYKKFGFDVEGEAKSFAFRNGEYVDAYYMARLKPQCQ